jgi:hypothetical protein
MDNSLWNPQDKKQTIQPLSIGHKFSSQWKQRNNNGFWNRIKAIHQQYW